jgi:hypothetical protein
MLAQERNLEDQDESVQTRPHVFPTRMAKETLAAVAPETATDEMPVQTTRSIGRLRTAMISDSGQILDDQLEDVPPMLPECSRTAMLLPRPPPAPGRSPKPSSQLQGDDTRRPVSEDTALSGVGASASAPRSRTTMLLLPTETPSPGPNRKRTAMFLDSDSLNQQQPAYAPSRTAMLPLSTEVSDPLASPHSGDDSTGTDSMPMTRAPTLLSRMSQRLQAGLRAAK